MQGPAGGLPRRSQSFRFLLKDENQAHQDGKSAGPGLYRNHSRLTHWRSAGYDLAFDRPFPRKTTWERPEKSAPLVLMRQPVTVCVLDTVMACRLLHLLVTEILPGSKRRGEP